MNQNQVVFVIDAGNSFLKVGVFRDFDLENVLRFEYKDLNSLTSIFQKEENGAIFISSVLSEKDTIILMESCPGAILFDRSIALPISILYESPETLGLDRICNSVACQSLVEGKNTLSIDLGTCIKFDFTDENGNYMGGSISPGIHLRYSSMNDYTGKLPLITDRGSSVLIGNNTINAMKSGVMNGIQAEIDQFMSLYNEQYQDLTFFVTGGDAVYFDFHSKNNTFVDENLTLKGLYQIYLFNAK